MLRYLRIFRLLCLILCVAACRQAAFVLPEDGLAFAADSSNNPNKKQSDAKQKLAPVWEALAIRLSSDGLPEFEVRKLLATLGNSPTQAPMGRKIRELYLRRFFPKPSINKSDRYYKGVVNTKNAETCREFVLKNEKTFSQAQHRYAVPPHIAAALLFVETRLGTILGDVPENAFYTLASMAVCRTPDSISDWLRRLPKHKKHLAWITENMNKRADWAYQEVRALAEYMLHEKITPDNLPGSIYGAIGLCQFMPSNINTYGDDGDGDGHIDLFTVADAIASLAKYLSRHGWKAGISVNEQHRVLMAYNHSRKYANTILALAELILNNSSSKPSMPNKKASANE